MNLSAAHRRFLVVDQGVAPVLFNLVLNGGIAWALFHSFQVVPLWGESSIAGDTLGTAFMLPFMTALIVSRLVRGQVSSGRVPPVSRRPSSGFMSRLVACPPWRRGAILGLAGVVSAALPVVGFLALAGPRQLDLHAFLWFKAGFAALLAGVVTPPIGWAALVAASPAAEPSGASR